MLGVKGISEKPFREWKVVENGLTKYQLSPKLLIFYRVEGDSFDVEVGWIEDDEWWGENGEIEDPVAWCYISDLVKLISDELAEEEHK